MPQLLIVGCSATKRHDSGELSALDRYDGPMFRVLRKARREDRWPDDLHVLIVSALFGLVKSWQPIPDYDQRMTAMRAYYLTPQVAADLNVYMRRRGPWTRVLVAAGSQYRVIAQSTREVQKLDQQGLVTWTHGGIGCQLAQMRAWLQEEQQVAA